MGRVVFRILIVAAMIGACPAHEAGAQSEGEQAQAWPELRKPRLAPIEPRPQGALDQVLLEGGDIVEGRIVSQDDVSVMFRLSNYGIIQIPKFKILRMAVGGRVEPLAVTTRRRRATPTPRPRAPRVSRLEIGGARPSLLAGLTTDSLSAAALLGAQAPEGVTEPLPMAEGSIVPAGVEAPAGVAEPLPTAEGSILPAEAEAAEPAAQAAPPRGPTTELVEAIVAKLETGGELTNEETSGLAQLTRKQRDNPESMTERERRAIELMTGAPPAT